MSEHKPKRRPTVATAIISLLMLSLFASAAVTWWKFDRADSRLSSSRKVPARRTGDLTSVFGSTRAVDTVRAAQTVRAYRLSFDEIKWGQEKIDESSISASPVNVSPPAAARLRKALLDPTIYGWNTAKGCWPDYGIGIQFAAKGDTVDVLFCFDCDMLQVYHNGKLVELLEYRNGKPYIAQEEDFDWGRAQLVPIMKELFPNDEVIQSLKLGMACGPQSP